MASPAKIKIAIATNSSVKKEAYHGLMNEAKYPQISGFLKTRCETIFIDVPPSKYRPEQPLTGKNGYDAAKKRIDWILNNYYPNSNSNSSANTSHFDIIIAIENYIEETPKPMEDIALGILYIVSEGLLSTSYSFGIPVTNEEYLSKIFRIENLVYPEDMTDKGDDDYLGSSVSYGDLYHMDHPEVPPNNWMLHACGINRVDQVREALEALFKSLLNDIKLLEQVGKIADWVEIIANYPLLTNYIDYLSKKYNQSQPQSQSQSQSQSKIKCDYVIGVGSIGTFIGLPLAQRLECGFIPITELNSPIAIHNSHTAMIRISNNNASKTGYSFPHYVINNNLPKGGNVLIIDEAGLHIKQAMELVKKVGHHVLDYIVLHNPDKKTHKYLQLPQDNIRIILE